MASQDIVYCDFSTPLTEEDLEEMRNIFMSMPTYRASDSSISTEDFAGMQIKMRYERSPEQVQGYAEYWNKHNNGRLQMEEYLDLCATTHRTSVLSYVNALRADKDKNGIITMEEFVDILKLMAVHDPKLGGKTYEDFVREADTHKNGKVSLDECAAWIEGQSASTSIWELCKTPYVWNEDEA
jgi:Ca2+-binding EF-hand superfamily protein